MCRLIPSASCEPNISLNQVTSSNISRSVCSLYISANNSMKIFILNLQFSPYPPPPSQSKSISLAFDLDNIVPLNLFQTSIFCKVLH